MNESCKRWREKRRSMWLQGVALGHAPHLAAMSSSSPPQPQYRLGKPFIFMYWSGVTADTPPKYCGYGSLGGSHQSSVWVNVSAQGSSTSLSVAAQVYFNLTFALTFFCGYVTHFKNVLVFFLFLIGICYVCYIESLMQSRRWTYMYFFAHYLTLSFVFTVSYTEENDICVLSSTTSVRFTAVW